MAPPQTKRQAWWRATLLVLALFAVTGATPLALAGEALGFWRLPMIGPNFAALLDTPQYSPALAHASSVVTNAQIEVRGQPGNGPVIATLAPGYGANVSAYATLGGERWAKIAWGGPTAHAGGSGWTLANGLVSGEAASSAREIGDLGALSPDLGQAATSLGPYFSAVVYFPVAGATYRTANSDALQPLGAQVAPLVLTAYYARGFNAPQPSGAAGPSQTARDLASDNGPALTYAYHLVGGADGLTSYLTQAQIMVPGATSFTFAAQPDTAQGTTNGLALFYTALLQGNLVNSSDKTQIVDLLTQANSAQASSLAPASETAGGPLVVATSTTSGASIETAAGSLTLGGATQVIVVARAQADSPAAAQTDLRDFFEHLAAVAA